jgi:starch phosphorylase
MGANSQMKGPPQAILQHNANLHSQYERSPFQFAGTDTYERHLVFDNVVDPEAAGPRERFEAFARSVRDVLSQRWIKTENT